MVLLVNPVISCDISPARTDLAICLRDGPGDIHPETS
jgi:hypothetical protein